MKFYLMAGGLLLTAASVYGVADYLKTKNSKQFKDLYKEVPVTLKDDIKVSEVKAEDYSRGKIDNTPLPAENKTAVAENTLKTKPSKKKKTKSMSYASAGTKAEITPVAAEPREEVSLQPKAAIAAAPKEKKAVRKKVNMKMFSRAAPREMIAVDTTTIKKGN